MSVEPKDVAAGEGCPWCGADETWRFNHSSGLDLNFACETSLRDGDFWIRGFPCYEAELAQAKELLDKWRTKPDSDDGISLLRATDAFLSNSAPSDYVVVNIKDYAVLKVLKSTMPPGASLVICYDDGSGVPTIQDDLYEEYVVVGRKDLEVFLKANERDVRLHGKPHYKELYNRLEAALGKGKENP